MASMTIYLESKWTKSREWCPHPEWWTSTDPQSTEFEVSDLVAGFVRALQPEYVIETGTCIGQTASAIGYALKVNGHGHLDTLETSRARAEHSRDVCKDLPVTVHEVASLEFTPDQLVDFAWLDSRLDLRIPEFERYRPWMHAGTLVGFHDTAPHHGTFGDDLAARAGVRAIRLHTPRGVTFAQVTA
jgi:predicted O-methyltransferase YrrM